MAAFFLIVLISLSSFCLGDETKGKDSTAVFAEMFAMELETAHDFAFTETRAGDEAHNIFCKCKFDERSDGRGLAEMCPGITRQCKESFCRPLCLRMAWQPRISVNCSRASTWSWCDKFSHQVEVAERALTAQFQAFTCMNLHFCNRTEHISQWIENHSFGDQYPKHHLPIDVCQQPGAPQEQKDLLCRACQTVVSVDIQRGECLPKHGALQPGSLQERCLYLADIISNQKNLLERQLKNQVCDCLGCCGTQKCIFKNPEEGWLENLVQRVTDKVTVELETQGWTALRKH